MAHLAGVNLVDLALVHEHDFENVTGCHSIAVKALIVLRLTLYGDWRNCVRPLPRDGAPTGILEGAACGSRANGWFGEGRTWLCDSESSAITRKFSAPRAPRYLVSTAVPLVGPVTTTGSSPTRSAMSPVITQPSNTATEGIG